MNFFGHCVLASWQSPEPEFALGSMLPDFAQMLGVARVASSAPVLAAGIRHHHLTDEVFHDSAVFTRLQRQAFRALAERGLSRGPRLAVAHVGVELMLDAELAERASHVEHYLTALCCLTPAALVEAVTFKGAPPASSLLQAYTELMAALLARRERLAPRDPDELAERLSRILARRPALALAPRDRATVAAWATDAWSELRLAVPSWLDELHAGLTSKGVASPRRMPALQMPAQGDQARRSDPLRLEPLRAGTAVTPEAS